MYKISLVVPKFWLNNHIFSDYDPNNIFQGLKTEFSKHNCSIDTYDILAPNEADCVFYMPCWESLPFLPKTTEISKSFLFIMEPSFSDKARGIYNIENHQYFNKIFTWNDELVDGVKYFKCFLINNKNLLSTKPLLQELKLCTLISSNLVAKHKGELYSERRRAIRWFEREHPEDFTLYGRGWDQYQEPNWFLRQLTKTHPLINRLLAKFCFKPYVSYAGSVEDKLVVLNNYKFAICYENSIETGYITEKIFDCFNGKCVPIYLGAPNITDFIPSNCFINKNDFASYEELYKYIKDMPDEEYLEYLANVEKFLISPQAYKFSMNNFITTVLKEILPY